jgi:hypothetical protein
MTALAGPGFREGARLGFFTAHEAIAPYLRVKHHSVANEVAIAGDEADDRAYAEGDPITVYSKRAPGTLIYIAAGAITAGDDVSSTTAGRVQTGSGGAVQIGKALTTTTVAGEQIEVLPHDVTTTMARSGLVQDDLQPYPIRAEDWFLFDSTIHAPLGATALSADDLMFTLGTLGATAPKLTATDFGGTSATQKARYRWVVPVEYVAGQTLNVKVTGLTGTTIADTSSTVDLNVYRQAAPSVDICATAAQTINSLTAVDVTFTLTPTNVVPGDILDILLTYAGVDAGNLGVIAPAITDVVILADIKG